MTRWLISIFIGILLQSCAWVNMSQEVEAGKGHFANGDYKQAFHELLPAAASGNASAQYAVGYMYYYGYGTSRDSESGLFWMNKAAAQGYRPAMKALEILHPHPTYKGEVLSAQERPLTCQEPPSKLISPPPRKHDSVPVVHTYKISTYQSSAQLEQVHVDRQKIMTQSKKYALQLFGAYKIEDVTKLQHELQAKNSTHIFQTEHNGKNWYVLTYGQYASAVQAKMAMDQLPQEMNELEPWVRNVSGLERA